MKRFLVLFVLLASSASAHEIGTTQVRALFKRDHTYVIEVIASPQAIVKRLHGDAIEKHVFVAFNQKPAAPRAELTANGIRLTGEIPPRAEAFTWKYDLTYSAYVLTLENESHGVVRQWLEGDAASAPFLLSRDVIPPTRLAVIRQYLELGFTHIVPLGFDHILFVVGLFLLTTRIKPLLAQVTAFTVAHSITLGLTMYGVVSLSPRIVEPAIALSIAYIAIENLMTSELKPWRVAIVFCFGLLHGMGFAGVLRELGLPRREFVTALVSFNAGVEGGQLFVIAIAAVVFARKWRARVVAPASLLIAATGLFWTVQRLIA
jgi:hydrogenase/urease accessory protein HupE